MTARLARFRQALAGCSLIALDPKRAHLSSRGSRGLEPYVKLTTALIADLASAAWRGFISTLTVAQLLLGTQLAAIAYSVRLSDSLSGRSARRSAGPLAAITA